MDGMPEQDKGRLATAFLAGAVLVVAVYLGVVTTLGTAHGAAHGAAQAAPLMAAPAGTIVDSDIVTDTVWTRAASPYTVTQPSGGIQVDPGVRLVIEPGVEVRFEQAASLHVYGTLIAIGTTARPITFTGTEATPGWWLGLNIAGEDFQHRNQGSVLRHVTIEYALVDLSIQAASATVSHATLRYSTSAAVMAGFASGTVIENSQIVDNEADGVVSVLGVILAANNWWGDASGPYHETCNPTGQGETVSDDVVFSPWLSGPGQEPGPVTASDAYILSVSPQRWFAPADGVTRIWVRLGLRDGHGQPVPGKMVRLMASLGDAVEGGVTDWKGETLAYLTSNTAGDSELSAALDWNEACRLVRSPIATVTFAEYADDGLLAGAAAPYMDDRIQIDPLPVVRGVPTTLSARLTNPNDEPILVNATFAYALLGMGQAFGPVGEVQDVRIEAKSDAIIQVAWTPPASGASCIRVDYAARPAAGAHLAASLQGGSQRNLCVQPGPLGSDGPGGGEEEDPDEEPEGEKPNADRVRKALDKIGNGQLALDAVTSPANVPGFFIPNLLFGHSMELTLSAWETSIGALSLDPPRQDYDTYATLEELTFTPLEAGEDISAERAAAANTLLAVSLDLVSRLRAAQVSLDRYGGAAAAGDSFWAWQQAAALIDFKVLSGEAMQEVADAIDAYLEVLRDEGISDLTVTQATVLAYQQRLSTTGWSAEEIQAAQVVGLSDDELEALRQERIAADPAEMAGSLMTSLEGVAGRLRSLSVILMNPTNFPDSSTGVILAAGADDIWLARIYGTRTEFLVGNPTDETASVDLRIRRLDLPPEWMVQVSPQSVTLEPGQEISATVSIYPGTASVQGTQPRVAIEGTIDDELIGGIVVEVMVPQKAVAGSSRAFLPLVLRSGQ